ncbi:Mitochondrial import inner membrane translocase subunit TIM17-2 [Acorus calamus]|uniref:Mitochondrial import inner membrane translocase subunit TIM17-2 n=1 Tax=Acorus calamus TaxID=4465 RepID=A0AAV9CFB2_ACOCL|nr:Mitochondrial import inner membrane translocase subunit TIM17-2 [Acorus calamus]
MGSNGMPREPWPHCTVIDTGGAFGMGAVGGSIFHFLKGAHHSPRGERLRGATEAVRMNAPRIGGSFAVWCALFSTFDCSMVHLRQKEDPWNSIVAGAASAGLLQMRRGFGPTLRAAAGGAVLLALIEGSSIALHHHLESAQNFPTVEKTIPYATSSSDESSPLSWFGGFFESFDTPNPPVAKRAEESPSSWFGGFFGGGGKKDKLGVDNVLESFDTPSPPVPTFDYK